MTPDATTTTRTKLTHEIAGPATMTGYGEPWGSEFADRVTRTTTHNLGCSNRLSRVSCRYDMRRFVTPFWVAQNERKARDVHCRRADV